jgi:hypothetical protein
MFVSPMLFDRIGWHGVANATPGFMVWAGMPFFAGCILFNSLSGGWGGSGACVVVGGGRRGGRSAGAHARGQGLARWGWGIVCSIAVSSTLKFARTQSAFSLSFPPPFLNFFPLPLLSPTL